jgi:hypothetical protein
MRMREMAAIMIASSMAITLCVSAGEARQSGNGYRYGSVTCVQGANGPGVSLRLRRDNDSAVMNPYPYLDIDIRELPVAVRKPITIGPDNWAFRCLDQKESCEQALSGTIGFDHFEDYSRKPVSPDGTTDGYYDLKFKNGGYAKGRFKAGDSPCA